MAYADLVTIQATDPGDILTAAWCDQVRDNDEFLVNPPACSVFASAAQSVADNTTTALTANSENFDNDSMHSLISQTSRITTQTAGRYLFIATVSYATGTGRRSTSFLKNGSTAVVGATVPAIAGGVTDRISIARSVVMASGDWLETQANQNSGGALNVTLDEFVAIFLTRA